MPMKVIEPKKCLWESCRANWEGYCTKPRCCEFRKKPKRFNKIIWKYTQYVIELYFAGMTLKEAINKVSAMIKAGAVNGTSLDTGGAGRVL